MTNEINFRGRTIKYAARPEYWKLIESNSWEPDTFNVLDRYVKSGTTVIDLGAWQGAISIYSRLLGAEVHAIEPDPVAYGQLIDNLKANEITDISSYNIAISDFNGEAELNSMSSEFGNSESSLLNRGFVKSTSVIEAWTLSMFLQNKGIYLKKTDLIKIDIEGGEVLVLKEALPFIKEFTPNIYLALHPAWIPNFDEFIQWIIDELFPIYNVRNPSHLDELVKPEGFELEIDLWQHAFVFEAKKQ